MNIVEKLDKYTEGNIRVSGRKSNRASELGWVNICKRYLVLVRIKPESIRPHDIGLQRIFDEGRNQEKSARMHLENAGYELRNAQKEFHWRKFQISGFMDWDTCDGEGCLPTEFKSCSPYVFQDTKKCEIAEDLLESNYHFVRLHPAQMMAYLLLHGKERGLILYKNKSTAEYHQVDCELNYDYMEGILKGLQEVNEWVAKGEAPPAGWKKECQKCPFESTECFVGKDFGPGYEFLSDGELEAKLNRWWMIKDLAKEWKNLDKELKEMFKGKTVVIGDYKIESSEHTRKTLEIPDDIKKHYQKEKPYYRTKIEKLPEVQEEQNK